MNQENKTPHLARGVPVDTISRSGEEAAAAGASGGGLPGPSEFQGRILDNRTKPELDYLRDRVDPARWGWNNLTEWLIDLSGLVEQRPAHMGRVRFERGPLKGSTSLIEEGISGPPDPYERLREERYRSKVRDIVEQWRAEGRL